MAQGALAAFTTANYPVRHVRRMRHVYRESKEWCQMPL